MIDMEFQLASGPGVTGYLRSVESPEWLSKRLDDMVEHGEISAILVDRRSGSFLLFAVRGEISCVQSNPHPSLARPYQWASEFADAMSGDEVEFNIGGTSTDMPMAWCVRPETMKKIVMAFFASGELDRGIPSISEVDER